MKVANSFAYHERGGRRCRGGRRRVRGGVESAGQDTVSDAVANAAESTAEMTGIKMRTADSDEAVIHWTSTATSP